MQQTNLEKKALGIDSIEESSPGVRNPNLWHRVSARLTPKLLRPVRQVFRTQGFRGIIRTYGWKAFLGFFCYYLVRDSILYLLIPYLVAKGFF